MEAKNKAELTSPCRKRTLKLPWVLSAQRELCDQELPHKEASMRMRPAIYKHGLCRADSFSLAHIKPNIGRCVLACKSQMINVQKIGKLADFTLVA